MALREEWTHRHHDAFRNQAAATKVVAVHVSQRHDVGVPGSGSAAALGSVSVLHHVHQGASCGGEQFDYLIYSIYSIVAGGWVVAGVRHQRVPTGM